MKALIAILLLPCIAHAELIISEILSNEPGDQAQLEWIELFNNSNTYISLGNYSLTVDGDSMAFPAGILESNSFVIVARQLVATAGQPSFENQWGNGSGYWGDDPSESYMAIDLNFSLLNSEGSIALHVRDGAIIIDHYEWSAANPDGISMERDTLDSQSGLWHQCTAQSGSTPGRQNSPPGGASGESVEIAVVPQLIQLSGDDRFRIDISAPAGNHGSAVVFDDTGRQVVKLLDKSMQGEEILVWNGRDNENSEMAPGIYFLHVTISGFTNVTKVIPVVIAP